MRIHHLALLGLITVLAYHPAGLFPTNPGPADPFATVHTRAGSISGTTSTSGDIHIFKGIPFAKPPIGALRWKAPQPVTPWQGALKCETFGPSPMQATPAPYWAYTSEFLIPEKPMSEDCLYLNVWTGAKTPSDRRPVIVFIYGGGFISGGTAIPVYDGEAMARKDVVFVSVNYRLGIFGFLCHPWLTAESGHQASGNYGLLDLIAALRWVQENIAAFGGDPSNVTIAGESAGSISVNCLVASPLAKGLFHRAIGESGAAVTRGFTSPATLKEVERAGQETTTQLNVADLKSLRALPADKLQSANFMRGPVVDGYVLPAPVGEIFRKRLYNPCDLLTGWNEDDYFLYGKPQTAAQFRQQLQQQYGAVADSALLFYPAPDDATALVSQERLNRDILFGVQNYPWADLQASDTSHQVFLYRFRRHLPATGELAKYGAFHGSEIVYAYNNLAILSRPWESADHQLAETMSTYWSNFARTGNPNAFASPDNKINPNGSAVANPNGTPVPNPNGSSHLPRWPQYTRSSNSTMILDEQPHTAPLPDKTELDFLLRTANQ
jgi:para-nitrobenzyl esterase